MIVKIKLEIEGSEASDCDDSSFKGTISKFDKETKSVGMAIYSAMKGVSACRAICALAVAVDMLRHDCGVSDDAEQAFCDSAENVINYWDDYDEKIQSMIKAREQQREI